MRSLARDLTTMADAATEAAVETMVFAEAMLMFMWLERTLEIILDLGDLKKKKEKKMYCEGDENLWLLWVVFLNEYKALILYTY